MITKTPRILSALAPLALTCLLGTVGCGGSQKEPEEPPLLEQQDKDVAAPSSPQVKEGIDKIQAGDFAGAEKLLAQATAEASEDVQAAYYYGVALKGVNKLPEAEVAYKRALVLEPKLTEASRNLSALLLALERPADARAVAEKGLESAPEDAQLLTNHAMSLDGLGLPEALPAYQKALAKDPSQAWTRYQYAGALAANGKVEEAKKELSQVPLDDVELATAVAQTYGALKDFAGCVGALNQAVAKNKSADLLVHRGLCKHSAKDDAGAGADFKAAVELEPASAQAHYYYGRHLLAAKKTPEGKAELQKAVDLGSATPFGEKAKQALAELGAPAAKKK